MVAFFILREVGVTLSDSLPLSIVTFALVSYLTCLTFKPRFQILISLLVYSSLHDGLLHILSCEVAFLF
jgi:hypothetical protein